MKTIARVVMPLWFAGLAAACGGSSPPPEIPPEPPVPAATPDMPPPAETAATPATPAPAPATPEPIHAEAAIKAASGSKVAGTAKFVDEGKGVKVTVDVENATPGDHAVHVHENGDCSDPKAEKAGKHFMGGTAKHGLPADAERHLGDMGNMVVDKGGKGHLEFMVDKANLKAGDPMSFLDKAIIVHAKKDDGGQPAGNAGDRIGCGVVQKK